MNLLKIKRKKSAIDLFESSFKNVKVWDKGKIEKNYDKRLPALLVILTELVNKYPFINFLILFVEKSTKKTWYSENLSRVVINLTFNPAIPEFNKELQKAIKDFQLIKSEIENLS